jgi:hypothetical protein
VTNKDMTTDSILDTPEYAQKVLRAIRALEQTEGTRAASELLTFWLEVRDGGVSESGLQQMRDWMEVVSHRPGGTAAYEAFIIVSRWMNRHHDR